MKNVIYAGFAQLSYLDWHELTIVPSGTKLKDIFGEKIVAFSEMIIKKKHDDKINRRTSKIKDDYKNMETDGQDYYIKKHEGKKIYAATDARSYYLYSEDYDKPDSTPFYSEFGDWEFIWGYDHNKILDEYQENNQKLRISHNDSGFQASVFKKDNKVMIAYRGTNSTSLVDWGKANADFKCGVVPDALDCAVWLYEKVATDSVLKNCEIHVTGHSMGGALAQYIGTYGYSATNPVIYITDTPLCRAVAKTVTWNALGVGNKNKRPKNNFQKDHVEKFKEFYDLAYVDQTRIVNYYLEYDVVPDIQNSVGKRVQVDKRAYITGSSRGGDDITRYHSVANFMPFFNDGNITPMKFNKNFLMNSIKQAIVTKNKVKDNEIEKPDFLKNLGIPELKKGTSLGNIINEMTNKEKSGKNYFYYCIEDNIDKNNTEWFVTDDNFSYIGLFNNMANIAGVEGGEPLIIELPKTEKKLKSFREVLDTILPPINSEKTHAKCDINALESHIEIIGLEGDKLKRHPLNYREKAENNGHVDLKIEKKEYTHNFYSKSSNKFGASIVEEEEGQIHLGCDFSYGRELPICCSHPPVYAPVSGTVKEIKKGKVVIENIENEKIISGEKVQVPYFHIIEHLHTIKVEEGAIISRGDQIGTMGGADSSGSNKYRYLQHVHYGIMMENRYFTGNLKTNNHKKTLTPKNFLRYINPEKFWDNNLEDGIGVANVSIKGGLNADS